MTDGIGLLVIGDRRAVQCCAPARLGQILKQALLQPNALLGC